MAHLAERDNHLVVRDLLQLPAWEGTRLMAGAAGDGRRVTGANIMEVPDIGRYVKPGEVLITTGYALRDDPEALLRLVRLLAAQGLAGLALKTHRYIDEIPKAVLEAADELSFPVLALAESASFNDMVRSVIVVLLSASAASTTSIRERLTTIALVGGGMTEIQRTLSTALDRDVSVIEGLNAPETETPWQFPVTIGARPWGALAIHGKEEPTETQWELVRQAAFAVSMHVAQARASVELDRRLRVLALEELVSDGLRSEPTLLEYARLYIVPTAGPRAVMVARCSPGSELVDVQRLAELVLGPGATAWSRGHDIVAIVSASEAVRQEPSVRKWRDALLTAGLAEVVVGLGEAGKSLDELGRAHSTAMEALRIALSTGRDVALYDGVAFERLVDDIPHEVLSRYVELTIGNLLRHDERENTQLADTLWTYLGTGNGALAARKLYVHYNTLKYRLGQLHELLGEDFGDPRVRLRLLFALEARRALAPHRTRPS
jgi:purine catabolism regulator